MLMLKTSIVAIIFFVMGFSASHLYKNTPDEINEPISAIEIPHQKQNSIPPKNVSTGVVKTSTQSTSSAPRVIKFDEPKTSFGYYQAFASLDNFSADEIANFLLSIDQQKTEMRSQIAWYLSGKYPEKVFELLSSNLVTSDRELSKMLAFNLSANQPDITENWIENNDRIVTQLFPSQTEKYQFKLVNLQALSRIPEYKWSAYEKGKKLIESGPKGRDTYSMLTLAQYTSSSDPIEAINYALSTTNGEIDSNLLNGALTQLANTDPIAARNYILEHEDSLNSMPVSAITSALIYRDSYDEAYSLVNSIKNPKLKESAINQIGSSLMTYGKSEAHGVMFVQALNDNESKIQAASSIRNSMATIGYSVEKQLEFLDQGLTKIPSNDKSWEYAWTLHTGYGKDSDAAKSYISQLEQRDPDLAKLVKSTLENLK